MYSRSSEPVRFERDCPVVLVPSGEEVTMPAGSIGYITQALGGSFTVFVEGNLMRVPGRDADAIGKEPPTPIELPEGAGDEDEEGVRHGGAQRRWKDTVSMTRSTTETMLASSAPPESETTLDVASAVSPAADAWVA